MKQSNVKQFRLLRLSALGRDDRGIAELYAGISNSPDCLVDALINRHGAPAHEAICAVLKQNETALRQTTEQTHCSSTETCCVK